jgi:hypothetical protein
VIVRRLRPGETKLLEERRLRALAEAPDAFARTHAEARDELTRSVTAPDRHVMSVAEDDAGSPLGMAFGVLQADTPRERGFRRIALWVTEENGLATSLDERMGFTPTGRADRFPRNPALSISEMARPL